MVSQQIKSWHETQCMACWSSFELMKKFSNAPSSVTGDSAYVQNESTEVSLSNLFYFLLKLDKT